LFIEAFESKTLKNKIIWITCAGISTGIFATAWKNGWWYVFDFVLATIVIYLVYLLAKDYKKINHMKSNELKYKYLEFFKNKNHAVIQNSSLIPEKYIVVEGVISNLGEKYDLYKEKKYLEVARYCARDLLTTKGLYEYWENFLKF